MSQGFGILPHYCSKIVGMDLTSGTFVTIRSCSQKYRNECKNPILVNGRPIDGCIYSCSGKYCNSSRRLDVGLFFLLLTLMSAFTCFWQTV